MPIVENKVTRRKLVGWMGIISLFTMAGAALMPWRNKKVRTVKMLTQDGKLVEVDARLLASNKTKISDKELQDWVRKQK